MIGFDSMKQIEEFYKQIKLDSKDFNRPIVSDMIEAFRYLSVSGGLFSQDTSLKLSTGLTLKDGYQFKIKLISSSNYPFDNKILFKSSMSSESVSLMPTNCHEYIFKFKRVLQDKIYSEFALYKNYRFQFYTHIVNHILDDGFSGHMTTLKVIPIGYIQMPSIQEYEKCHCNMQTLMSGGCKCGGFEREKEYQKKLHEFNKKNQEKTK